MDRTLRGNTAQNYGLGRVYLDFQFQTNGASNPTMSTVVGTTQGTAGAGQAPPPVVMSLTRSATGVIVVQLSSVDTFNKVIYLGAELDDSAMYPLATSAAPTVAVTNNSTSITFSSNVTLANSTQIVFSSQPNVPYTLSGAISGATAGTLTVPYNGPTAAAAAGTLVNALAGTVTLAASTSITFSQNQTLPAGTALVFALQPGTVYYLASAVSNSTAGTLTASYSGTTGSTSMLAFGDGAYASTGNIFYEGVAGSTAVAAGGAGIQFTIRTHAAAGALTDYTARLLRLSLSLRNTVAGQ